MKNNESSVKNKWCIVAQFHLTIIPFRWCMSIAVIVIHDRMSSTNINKYGDSGLLYRMPLVGFKWFGFLPFIWHCIKTLLYITLPMRTTCLWISTSWAFVIRSLIQFGHMLCSCESLLCIPFLSQICLSSHDGMRHVQSVYCHESVC